MAIGDRFLERHTLPLVRTLSKQHSHCSETMARRCTLLHNLSLTYVVGLCLRESALGENNREAACGTGFATVASAAD